MSRGTAHRNGVAPDARFAAMFDAIAKWVVGAAHASEVLFVELRAERADYLRLNRARVRQAGSVERAIVLLRLFDTGRQAHIRYTLTASRNVAAALDEALREIRTGIAQLSADPFASWQGEAASSECVIGGVTGQPAHAIDVIVEAAAADDLVGFYAAGPVVRGLASSLGHRHYHETRSSSFDYSIHVSGARAVKEIWSARHFDAASLRASIVAARDRARVLRLPVRRIDPGAYRAVLSSRAVADLIGLLGWGGFSERAWRSGQSPLMRAHAGERQFDPAFEVFEDADALGVPRFQSEGFLRAASLPLIRAGASAQRLVSPRSAREFGVDTNGADDDERPLAARVATGRLAESESLAALGTGIVIENLWYLNYSDRQACRATGMTRFATLWVERGEAVAPIEAMRFDDSLYRLFGPGLLALSDTARTLPQVETWDGREPGGVIAPAALVEGLRLTL